MNIGFSVFLIAVGAVLAFGVRTTVEAVNLRVIGWILMIAGALTLVLTLLFFWSPNYACHG